MADKWCDHGAYGAYAAVPTWGQAQDGDGTAKAVGTPATASVVFTGVPSSGVIAVLGQTITFTHDTSADVCANNLATAINASTAVATGPASFTTLSQVRNHLYARGPATGAPAGTCQIMTRQASADHAGLIAVTHTLNNVSSPATINFAGGSGGCWGWLFNNLLSIWPSAVAVTGYGMLGAISCYTGALLGGDLVHVRAGKVIPVPNGSAPTMEPAAMGSSILPVTLRLDDGSQWPEDGAEPTVDITASHTAGNSFTLRPKANCFMHLAGRQYGPDFFSLRFLESGSGYSPSGMQLIFGTTAKISNFHMEVLSGTSDVYFGNGNVANSIISGGFENFYVKNPRPVGMLRGTYVSGLYSAVTWKRGVFDNTGNPNPHLSWISQPGGDNQPAQWIFDGVRFKGFVVGSALLATDFAPQVPLNIIFRNCDLGGMTNRGPWLNTSTSNMRANQTNRSITIAGSIGAQDFSVDYSRGFVEWNSQLSFPTLNARLVDGVTPWALRVQPTTQGANISALAPLELPAVSKVNSLADGLRTVTVELAIEESLGWNRSNISLSVSYQDTNGSIQQLSSYDPSGAPLDTSSAVWSQESGGQVTFSNGGTIYHDKYRIALTTPAYAPMASGTVVHCYVQVHTPVTTAVQSVFVDPEIVIA